ncbi:hypothetical protein [Chondrinema litorale]|uniref:hypothetical protein n=1 Tax=Chondrinema litorale TaxID=2994555 RepID=UPI0025436F31|nr:hypothetical protein [Chondrinema litorale]UZR96779.1 hypothetical protein OQ292_24065 [Chondrinema litorale]
MRIAIDLDGTLVRGNYPFPLEKVAQEYEDIFLSRECLRAGICELYSYIKESNYEFWIYTFSFRKIEEIECLFKKYNVQLDGIINYMIHKGRISEIDLEELRWIQKYPPAFGIDLLVDDLEEVKLDGDRLKFEVLLLKEKDLHWVEKVIDKLNELGK